MDANDLVLCVVRRAGVVPGRTALQKLCYFANEKLNAGIAYRAHYYGPFSRDVAASTDLLVISNFLSESVAMGALSTPTVRPTGGLSTEWEQHAYQVTNDGERFYAKRAASFRDSFERAGIVVDALKGATNLDATALSELAKVHFLRKNTAASSPEEIASRASEFQWKLSTPAVGRVLNRLGALSL